MLAHQGHDLLPHAHAACIHVTVVSQHRDNPWIARCPMAGEPFFHGHGVRRGSGTPHIRAVPNSDEFDIRFAGPVPVRHDIVDGLAQGFGRKDWTALSRGRDPATRISLLQQAA